MHDGMIGIMIVEMSNYHGTINHIIRCLYIVYDGMIVVLQNKIFSKCTGL